MHDPGCRGTAHPGGVRPRPASGTLGGMHERHRTEPAAFLRSRRERLRPADVGLPEGGVPGAGRRRTPGLRRQEVAQLAGMSIDYYIRLEQGRDPQPSRQVLAALTRALMLTVDEREYLFRLAGENPPATTEAAFRALAARPAPTAGAAALVEVRHDAGAAR